MSHGESRSGKKSDYDPCACGSGDPQVRCCGVSAAFHPIDDDCPLCRMLADEGAETVELEFGEGDDAFRMLMTNPPFKTRES